MAVLESSRGLAELHVAGWEAQCSPALWFLMEEFCLQAVFQNPFEVAFSLIIPINVLYN